MQMATHVPTHVTIVRAIREVLLHIKRERVRVTSDSGVQIATRHVRVR